MSKRLLIYLFPALIDGVVAQVLFVNTVRAARMGVSALAVGGMLTLWSLVYAFSSPLVGRLVRPGNAAAMMISGCLVLAAASLAFIGVDRIALMYLLVAVCSVAMAFFFTPFQVFMKAVALGGGGSLAASAGVYTFAWSSGFAIGPFVSGFLMELDRMGTTRGVTGWQWTYVLGACVALLTAGGVRLLSHLAHTDPPARLPPRGAGNEPVRKHPLDTRDLAWLGWTAGAAGVVVLTIIRGVFPVRAVALNLSNATLGTYFFLLSMTQACCALALTRGHAWMYRPGPALAFGTLGVLGTLLTGWGCAPLTLYTGAMAFGAFMGALFFVFVFYALVHPSKSARNVARNELVVGFAGIIGPTLGGLMGDAFTLSSPYVFGAMLVAAAAVLQGLVLRPGTARLTGTGEVAKV